jgi:hypothetical protein
MSDYCDKPVIGPGTAGDGGGGIPDRTLYLTRTIPVIVDDFVEIGAFTDPGDTFAFDIQAVCSDAGFSVAARYFIAIGTNLTDDQWRIVPPFVLGDDIAQPQTFDLDVKRVDAENKLYLRIRRTAGAAPGTVKLTIFYDGLTNFTSLIGTGSDVAPTETVGSALITQTRKIIYLTGEVLAKLAQFTFLSTTVPGFSAGIRCQDRLYIVGSLPVDLQNSELFLYTSLYTPAVRANTSAGVSIFDDASNLGINVTGSGKVGIRNSDPLASLDVAASTTAEASLRLRTGVAPTAPNIGDMWSSVNALNFVNYSGIVKNLLDPTNKVIVSTIDDFPAPIAGKINLEAGKNYELNAPINSPYEFILPVGGNVQISSVAIFEHILSYTGSQTMFTGTNINSLTLQNLIISAPAGTAFDLDGPSTGLVYFNSFILNNTVAAGIIRNVQFFCHITQQLQIGSGYIFENLTEFAVGFTDYKFGANTSTSFYTIRGSIGNIFFNNNFFQPQTNESVFDIEQTSTTISAVVVGNAFNFDLGGQPFAVGSKNQTDVYWTFRGNGNLADSTALGDMSVLGNVEETFIGTISVPVPVNATWSDQTERFVLDTIIKYDTQTTDFTVGLVLSGTVSGASGTIIADDDQGTTGTLTLNNVTGQFSLNELIIDPNGGSANISAPSGTIPAPVSGRLRYIGLETIQVRAAASTQLRPSTGTNIKLATYIAKNGISIDKSEGTNLISSSDARSIFSQALVTVSTGDYIELFVENEDTTAGIYVEDGSLIATKI